jgi:hypothetical protein
MKFRKGNKIRYSQDFHIREGVPSGVDFQVVKMVGGANPNKSYKLVADGYGSLERNKKYGCGAIFIHTANTRLRERLERNCKV